MHLRMAVVRKIEQTRVKANMVTRSDAMPQM
jgi:hypothetical protein